MYLNNRPGLFYTICNVAYANMFKLFCSTETASRVAYHDTKDTTRGFGHPRCRAAGKLLINNHRETLTSTEVGVGGEAQVKKPLI